MSEPFAYLRRVLNHSLPDSAGSDYWRSLFYFNLYRFSIAIFLLTAGLSELSVGSLGSRHADLFTVTSIAYAFLALVFAFMIHNGWLGYIVQSWVQIYFDLVVIVILIHASGGLGSGLEVMLIISIAAAGILLGGQHALAAAALATLFLLTEHAYVILSHQRRLGGFTAQGFMGMGLFITAFFMHYLSQRLRRSEVRVEAQQVDISELSRLNEYVIEQLDSGVLVIDADDRIRVTNARCRELLGSSGSPATGETLADCSAALTQALATWRGNMASNRHELRLPSGTSVLVRFSHLGATPGSGTIILMDDLSNIERERQNDKLIAMGRLSASIAHEIRNPLGAISHAGQLLGESPGLGDDDGRLVEIIAKQSRRINRTIETILDLGRPAATILAPVRLRDWLTDCAQEFIHDQGLPQDAIAVSGPGDCVACLDRTQMQLVLNNLCSNALIHGDPAGRPLIRLEVDREADTLQPLIRVFDSGPGIDENLRDRIFEPFFTTSSTGNGLGLYIARRICLDNRGDLDYIAAAATSPHFRIRLASGDQCGEDAEVGNNGSRHG